MNFPNSTSRDLTLQHHLEFKVNFMNLSSEEIDESQLGPIAEPSCTENGSPIVPSGDPS